MSKSTILSKEDVKALRKATDVGFVVNDKGDCYIRACYRERMFQDNKWEYIVPAIASHFIYDADAGRDFTKELDTCFHWESAAQYSEEWQTIAKLIKAGDVIELRWQVSGSPNQIESGFIKNALIVRLVRDNGNSLSFNLYTEVVKSEFSVRMIKVRTKKIETV